MKSQLEDMLQIWSAASYDATLSCALSQVERARDLARLTSLVSSRGLGVFTLDLPTLDTLLLSLLENGHVVFEGPFGVRRSKKDQRPRFLHGFWALVCDESGCLKSDASPEAIFAIRQLSCLWKKLEVACSPKRVKDSVDEYFAIEAQMPQPSPFWGRDYRGDVPNSLFRGVFASRRSDFSDLGFLLRLDKVAGILLSSFGSFDSLSDDSPETGYFKHGPGAVANLKGGEYKYSFPSWSARLERVFPFDWCSGERLDCEERPSRVVPPSRLLAVPKTAKAPRLIAAEPVEHQWCQQKIKTFLDYQFRRSIIGRFFDPSNQTLSQRLVAQAARDRSLATIDLSSASDRVSCWHVECLLRVQPSLLEACAAVRTDHIEDTLSSYGVMPLRKFASMGSALTFPIQSLFFLAVALASCGVSTPSEIRSMEGKVRVFGDDIIVPNEAYDSVTRNLTALGLKVNLTKSFSKGAFRESCGLDCWNDVDVTPVKPRVCTADAWIKAQALLDTSNNLFKKGLWRASNTIVEMLPVALTRNVFSHKVQVPGLVSFSGSKVRRPKWDKDLHRWYVLQPVVVKRQERVAEDSSLALREFHTRPFCAERARETGRMLSTVAKLAAVRVDTEVLG